MAAADAVHMMAKFGMTLCALGIAEELRHYRIASNTLWPRASPPPRCRTCSAATR